MNLKTKRILSRFMTGAISLSVLLTTPAFAVNVSQHAEEEVVYERIDLEVARHIAQLHVDDFVRLEIETKWTESTKVSNITPMYDTEENITAYTANLQTNGKDAGYVVVSAYGGIENVILEFSDEAAPTYEELDIEEGDKVVFVGPLAYYKDTGDENLVDVDSAEIPKDEVTNQFEELEEACVEAERQTLEAGVGISLRNISATTDDPYAHAKEYYGNYGGIQYQFYLYESKYPFSQYGVSTGNSLVSNYADGNPCVPVALTNLTYLYGKYNGVKPMSTYTQNQLYDKILQWGIAAKYYSPAGVDILKIYDYLELVFKKMNVSVTAAYKDASYANIRTEINAGRPFILAFNKNATAYKNHAVTGIGYIRLDHARTGAFKSYVKVADGNRTDNRFIDLAFTTSDTNMITFKQK